ncbi:crossover junction endodeoxyribonuclease RuvC [Derxia gummosa]|uniref:Crossover junction endodeoxyribonuclease RuvC n=1 Tax=Derxia gummosa DSM 723 TaxID=1121388 RepID=A0A8B6X5R5_9BURK|nr:crossover junction endodeoxyribonuclease RuvC [Derxia gummosa]
MTTAAAPQRILGIDPGLQRTGFGVIDRHGARLSYVASGVIRTDVKQPLAERLGTLVRGIQEIAGDTRPDCAAVEIVFVNVNPQSTLLLGQARGAALAALVLAGLPVHEYTALQVKKATVGTGHARKQQVQDMVVRLLTLSGTPQADAADALACAITHAHAGHGMGAAAQAVGMTAQSGRVKFRRGRVVG